MNKVFMLDIETMGIDIKNHDIIQIGILECIKNDKGFYVPARSFMKVVHSDQESTDPWILQNHAELLPLSRAAVYESPIEIRAQILAFFQQCGITEKAVIMGLNACVFDIPFMVNKGFLKETDIHYRVYELRGSYNLAIDVLGDKALKLADSACDWINLPTGKKHEALYDCYAQIKCLNGIIKLMKSKVA